jgi:hypothetical protein
MAVLTKIHHAVVDGVSGSEISRSCSTRAPRAATYRAVRGVERRARPRGCRDARPRTARTAAAAASGGARPADGAPERHRAARSRRGSRGADAHACVQPRPPAARLAGRPRRPEGNYGAAPAHVLQRTALPAPPVRVRLALARHGQGHQEDARDHRQRRGRRTMRERPADVAAGTRRAARRPTRRDGARVGADEGAARNIREPRVDDGGSDPHRRARSEPPPGADARSPARRKGASQRPARRPAHRRHAVHPARGDGARGAEHGRGARPHACPAERRDLERPPSARRCSSRARASRRTTPSR